MDSTLDTRKHMKRVMDLLIFFQGRLDLRGAEHDKSKLGPEEKPIFDEFTPKLAGSLFGSDEYKGFLAAMKPALDHHYAENSHHPEHYPEGINGMDLFDIMEMLADWKAASERHATGDIRQSLALNAKRFAIGDQLFDILRNTITRAGW